MASAEFGKTVRRWRERTMPQAAGLPAGGRRRAPGLRREELAQLAGISMDYLTRLEQGRAANPSAQVVEALARALRLGEEERAHLFRLAGLAEPGPETVPEHIPPSVQRMLDRLAGTPVAVYDATWTLLTANQPYAALMGDPSGWRGLERNGVWRNFIGPGSRSRMTGQARREFDATQVADLRAVADRYPRDPRLRRLVAELRAGSEKFRTLWDEGAVGRHASARKTIEHPQVGLVHLDCDILTVEGSDIRLMVFTAQPETEDAERLALLTVLGTQPFEHAAD
ncbi:MAG TPA: helix-turn-helix transcriptional regulator [Trebonia sp.]|jgi:transcriptional regulator with XRE-family HTH domain|nr:helix-turn-helix transcriptional regulator [Trebonia sp.]